MAMIKRKVAVLINARDIEFDDKQTGEKVHKVAYTFLDKDGKLETGYQPTDVFKKFVRTVEEFTDQDAYVFTWEGRTWVNPQTHETELRYKLLETQPEKPKST